MNLGRTVFSQLIEHLPSKEFHGRTPLMAAARDGDVPAMKLLLAKKADAAARSSSGAGALMDAARSRSLEAVHLLLENGASVATPTRWIGARACDPITPLF